MTTVIAIDISNFAYKQYHAGGNVATAIVQKARGAMTHFRDSVAYLCYDSKPTFRHKLFPEYKGKRKPSEDKVKIEMAIEESKPIAVAAGVHVVEHEGYEADDVMASIARQCRLRNENVMLVSADKDMYPLLMYDGIQLFRFIGSQGWDSMLGMKIRFIDEVLESAIYKKYKVECWQWLDYRCMTGDASDNIAGLAGYGPVKSRLILDTFESLDQMFGDWETNKLGFSDQERIKFEIFRNELPRLRELFRMVDTLDVLRH